MARRLIIDDRTGVLYEDFTGRRIASLGELLNAEAGATETVEVFSVAVNPQTRAVTANTILTANVSLDLGVPRAKPTGGKLTVTYGSDTSGEIPIETLTAETLSSALNRLDAMETAGGCDVWRAAEDDSELSFYVRLHNNGAPGTNPSFDCDGATPPAIGEVTVVKAGASSERSLWLVNIAEKPVASIAESAWSTVTSGSFGGLTASLALNGAGLIAHLSKENPGELTLTVKNSSSVLYRGTVDALSSVDPTDLNGSAILSIFPRIVTSTSDPGVTDDSGDGYAIGTLWVNTSADTYFVLADSTAGAAVWVSHLHLTGGTMTGAIAMGSNKITGLADGTASGDAINKGQLDGLIDDAPEALNTLNELAAALGDNANFSTTVLENIAEKLPLAGGTMTGALNTLDINLTDSDVAHGITNVAATDAYGHLSTIHGTQGGLYINGISDQESASARSLALRGICNDTHTDTVPTVEIIGAKRSGTTVQALADAETVLTVANHTSTLLTVLGSGNTGIGTTTPGAKAEIAGPNTGIGLLRIRNLGYHAGDMNGIDFFHYTHSISKGYIREEAMTNWDTKLHFGTSATGAGTAAVTRMTIDGVGNVGIGLAVPEELLHLQDSSLSPQIRIDGGNGSSDGTATLGLYEQRSGQFGFKVKYDGANNRFDILSRVSDVDTARLTIDRGSGRVGINTTAPSSLLDIRGDAGYPGILTLSTSEPTVVDSNQLGRIDFSAPDELSGSDALYVGASIHAEADAEFSETVNTTDLVFSTGTSGTATEKMRLTSAGNLGIGVANPTSLLTLVPPVNTPAIGATGYQLSGSSSVSLIDLAGTWTTTGTPTAIKLNVTNTASNAASLLMDLQVGGTSKFSVKADGRVTATRIGCLSLTLEETSPGYHFTSSGFSLGTGASERYIGFGNTYYSGTPDVRLYRDAASILGLRVNGAAQELRIYSDLGDPTGNFERGSFAMDTSGDLTIATEAGGTGTVGEINLAASVTATGGMTYSGVQAVTASANLATTAYYCPVSTGGGSFTLTIPTAQHIVGRKIIVKDIDGYANTYNITIATESSQTIDGNATAVISTAKGYRELICTSSTTWHIIASDA